MADQGADYNFIAAVMMRNIREGIPSVGTKVANSLHVYRRVTGEPCSTCSTAVIMDVYLRTRNGSGRILRNIEWNITKESIANPIIGRRVLESLGCNNREMFPAAKSKHGDDIDVTK